jgi:hypothetical protein
MEGLWEAVSFLKREVGLHETEIDRIIYNARASALT